MNNHVPNVLVFNRYFIFCFCFFTCPPVHTFSASLQTFCQTATWRPRGRFSCHFSCFVSSVQQEVQYLCSGFLFIIYSAKLESHRSITECSSVCFHVVNQLSSYVSCTILNCSQVIKCEKFSDFLPFNNKGATTPSSYSQSLDGRKVLRISLYIIIRSLLLRVGQMHNKLCQWFF